MHNFFITSRSVFLTMRTVSDKSAEKIKIRILYAVTFFFYFEILAVCEIMWKNIVEPDRPDDNMAHAHCMLDKVPATQNAVCRSGLRSLSAAECYILSRLF